MRVRCAGPCAAPVNQVYDGDDRKHHCRDCGSHTWYLLVAVAVVVVVHGAVANGDAE